jgi:hypothetical protein
MTVLAITLVIAAAAAAAVAPVSSSNTVTVSSSSSTPKIRIGAVRWDGCVAGIGASVDNFCSHRLALPSNRYRMPFYAKADRSGSLILNATKHDISAEVAYAQSAGLSFFAFVMYRPSLTGLGTPLQWFRELSVARQGGMQWCMILESSDLVPPGGRGNAGPLSLWLQYVQDSNYLTVDNGRPVVHILHNRVKTTQVFDAFNAMVKKSLGVAVYWAGMAPSPATVNKTLPVDAVSAYTLFPRRSGDPYASLVAAEQSLWEDMARSGLHAIPTVTPNMDPRPMFELPNGTYSACGWCNCDPATWMRGCHLPLGSGGCRSGNCSKPEHWAQPPLKGEVSRHTAAMIAFLKANAANGVSPHGLGMIGAWK